MTARDVRAIALWLGGVAVAIVVVGRTEFSTDMSAFLPRAPAQGQQILVDQLRNGVVSRLILVALEGAEPATLARLSKALAARLRAAPELAFVGNGEDAGLAADRDFLWRNRYLLSPAVDAAHFSVPELRRALERDLGLLGSSAAPLIKQGLPHDPTGEILVLIERLTGEAGPPTRDGVWLAPTPEADGSRALLVAQTRAAGFDLDGQALALAVIDQALASARPDVPGADAARLLTSGPGVFAVRARAAMKAEVSRLSMLATGLVAGLLLLAYRAPRLLPLAFLPVASGALAGVAAVGLGFGYVHGITLGFGVTLIGEAVDYAIYLFTQTAPGAATAATVPRIWPTLRLGVLTSICGFAAMLFSSFTGFAQLGLFTIAGLVVAAAVMRWILPVVVPRGVAVPPLGRLMPSWPALLGGAARLRVPLAAVALLALGVLAAQHGRLWQEELASLNPVPIAEQRLDQALRRASGAPDVRHLLMVDATDQETALTHTERLAARLAPLIADGTLAGFDAPARYLPSRATQRARQAALPEPAVLRADLDHALAGLPFRAAVFAPFLADVAAARLQALLGRDDLRDTGLGLRLDSLLFERPAPQGGGWVALMPLREVADPARLAQAVAAWREPDVSYLDLKHESDRLLALYRDEALWLALLGAGAIVVLLAVTLRSRRRVWAVVAPLVGAVLVTAALLSLGGRLSIFNLFGLLLVVAVGSNYCLFFERLERLERDDTASGRTVSAVVLANLCTVVGFGVLAVSSIPVLHGIGTTVAIGTFICLIFSASWTPSPGPRAAREG
ncbi:MAG: MMPL family transporter [Proteobacteria bacterium]|nr:MMPL family transporter [Pseudomonadota bacterium]